MLTDYQLRLQYGISLFEFECKLDEQGGRCGICLTNIRGVGANGRVLARVDHNHVTGKVRGLLCGNCNTGLGMFKDSIRVLAGAIVYLEDNDPKATKLSSY